MEPLERLLNLVGLLLETRTPLTFEQIRETLEPYRQEKVDSAKRMFERDKDILRDYGVPLRIGRHGRLGHRAGIRDPQGRVLPAGDRVHPGGVRRALRCRAGRSATTRRPRRPFGSSWSAPREACWPAWRAGLSPRVRMLAARSSWRSPRRHRITGACGSGTARPRAPSRNATSTRIRRCSAPDTGTSSGSIASEERPRSFRLSRFTSISPTRERGASRPKASVAADLVASGPWTAAGEERATVALSPDIAWWATATLIGARTRRDARRRMGGGHDPDGRRTRARSDPASVRPRRGRRRSGEPPDAGRGSPGGAPCLRRARADGRRRPPKTAERLGRMLVIVPYLVQHAGESPRGGGGPVRRAARAASARSRPALHVRSTAVRSRRPDRGGRRRGRSHLDLDGGALRAAAPACRGARRSRSTSAGRSCWERPACPKRRQLESALEKLRTSLGPETLGDAERIETADPGAPIESLEPIRSASRDRHRVRVDYFAHSSGEWSSRVIDPEEVFVALGHWYVAAWDVSADGERLFRADRIRSVGADRRTLRAARPGGRGPIALHADRGRRLRAAPVGSRCTVDRRVLRDHGRARREPDGSLDITLPHGRWDGSRGCCCGWETTRPCWSHPN